MSQIYSALKHKVEEFYRVYYSAYEKGVCQNERHKSWVIVGGKKKSTHFSVMRFLPSFLLAKTVKTYHFYFNPSLTLSSFLWGERNQQVNDYVLNIYSLESPFFPHSPSISLPNGNNTPNMFRDDAFLSLGHSLAHPI